MKYERVSYDLPQSTKECTEDFTKYNGEGTLLKRVQNRSLQIMIEFDRICRKHNIQYWLIGGSLLGAVRHQGFIPWDDDIDVTVAYSDIPKLRKLLKKELPPQFVYQDWTTDDNYFLDSVVKIRDTKSYFPIEVYKGFKEQGLLLDIIPFEKIPSLRVKNFVMKVNKYPYLRKKELSIYGKTKYNVSGLLLTPLAELVKWIAHFCAARSKSKIWRFSYTYIFNKYEIIAYNEDDFFPLKETLFEGNYFLVPNNAVQILKQSFGEDCLEIPDNSKRLTHSMDVVFYD